MLSQVEDYNLVETKPLLLQNIQADGALSETLPPCNSPQKISNSEIRSSLRASTFDGVLATLFDSVTGGVLISNFLLELGAGPVEIGMISSIPMLVNLLQPLGAYLADQTTSRRRYSLWIFLPARLMWLILVPAIGLVGSLHTTPQRLVQWTLAIIWVTHILEAFGNASWLSWMAALVPQRLRGRYFGFRNSASSLTNLIGVPLLGLAVSAWPGGTLSGYGAVVVFGVVVGLLSMGCQLFMTDVNPQLAPVTHSDTANPLPSGTAFSFLKDANFLKFLLYFGLWSFAVNVSAPFFNLYMLDNLGIDFRAVTSYSSLNAGANLLMLVFWGKLADRIGNRPLLLIIGVLVSLTPLLWLGAGSDAISLWVWLPLLHLLDGGTWAAVNLCNNNLQMAVAPLRNQSSYFAIAAAVGGVCGAMGITAGGFLATPAGVGGVAGLFALSAVLRLAALLPLVFVQEQRSVPLAHLIGVLFPVRRQIGSILQGTPFSTLKFATSITLGSVFPPLPRQLTKRVISQDENRVT